MSAPEPGTNCPTCGRYIPKQVESWDETRMQELCDLWPSDLTNAQLAERMRTSPGRLQIMARMLGLPYREIARVERREP